MDISTAAGQRCIAILTFCVHVAKFMLQWHKSCKFKSMPKYARVVFLFNLYHMLLHLIQFFFPKFHLLYKIIFSKKTMFSIPLELWAYFKINIEEHCECNDIRCKITLMFITYDQKSNHSSQLSRFVIIFYVLKTQNFIKL